MKRMIQAIVIILLGTAVTWAAGSWSPNNFSYKPQLTTQGTTDYNNFNTSQDRVDARLAKEVWVGDPNYGTTIEAAMAAIGTTNNAILRVPPGNYTIASTPSATYPNITLCPERGALITINSSVVFTCFLDNNINYQVFAKADATASIITLYNTWTDARVFGFAASVSTTGTQNANAINDAMSSLASGGVVKMPAGTYPCASGLITVVGRTLEGPSPVSDPVAAAPNSTILQCSGVATGGHNAMVKIFGGIGGGVRNICLDGNYISPLGLLVNGSYSCDLSGLGIKNTLNDGVRGFGIAGQAAYYNTWSIRVRNVGGIGFALYNLVGNTSQFNANRLQNCVAAFCGVDMTAYGSSPFVEVVDDQTVGVKTHADGSNPDSIVVSQTWEYPTPVRLKTTGTMPGGLSTNTIYYAKAGLDSSHIQLAAYYGGARIQITTTGSGVLTLSKVRSGYLLENMHNLTLDTCTAESARFDDGVIFDGNGSQGNIVSSGLYEGCGWYSNAIQGAVAGATTTITIKDHGLVAGDYVNIGDAVGAGNWAGLINALGAPYAVTVIDRDTFTIPYNSTGYPTYSQITNAGFINRVQLITAVTSLSSTETQITAPGHGITSTGERVCIIGMVGAGNWATMNSGLVPTGLMYYATYIDANNYKINFNSSAFPAWDAGTNGGSSRKVTKNQISDTSGNTYMTVINPIVNNKATNGAGAINLVSSQAKTILGVGNFESIGQDQPTNGLYRSYFVQNGVRLIGGLSSTSELLGFQTWTGAVPDRFPRLVIDAGGTIRGRDPNTDTADVSFSRSAAGIWSMTSSLSISSNLMFGNLSALGTSAAGVLGAASAVQAPTTAPANAAQLWVEDINGAAGKAGWHIMDESGTGKLVVAGVLRKTDTGDPVQAHEGMMCINTADKNVKIYADGGWRTIASGW